MVCSARLAVLVAVQALLWVVLATPSQAARPTWIVLEHGSGKVVAQDGADEQNYPASLTKMMTLYLAFDALRAGRMTLGSQLRVSKQAATMPPSKLGLRPGSRIRLEDAIQALTVKSANDIAVVIAEALGGSEERFAQQMTRVARLKGLRDTTFRNASGLPHAGQVTTARDMALLARRLIVDFPQYYAYFGQPSFTFAGRSHGNHNRLLATYKGMDGLKTGFIRAAGYNLAASAVRDGRRLVAVVLGGSSTSHRNALMAQVLDDGFATNAPGVLVASATTQRAPTIRVEAPSAALVALAPAPLLAEPAAEGVPSTAQGDADPSHYAVQVGAFAERRTAMRIASKAAAMAPRLAAGSTVDVERIRQKRPLYAGRLVGFTRTAAGQLCDALRRQKQTCFVVKLDGPETATN